MKRTMPLAALLLFAVWPVLAQEAPAPAPTRPQVKTEEVEFKGVTLDTNGKPLAGATVATMWVYKDGAWTASAGVQSDTEGKFTLKMRTLPDQAERTYRVQAHDAESKLGVIAMFKAAELKAGQNLTLRTLVEVSAKVSVPEGYQLRQNQSVSIALKTPPVSVAAAPVKDGAISIKLPAGEYSYMMYMGSDFKSLRGSFSLAADKPKLELEPFKVELSALALSYGKQAPAIAISHVRNLPADLAEKGDKVTLADFKGRWVLLEFWGFW